MPLLYGSDDPLEVGQRSPWILLLTALFSVIRFMLLVFGPFAVLLDCGCFRDCSLHHCSLFRGWLDFVAPARVTSQPPVYRRSGRAPTTSCARSQYPCPVSLA